MSNNQKKIFKALNEKGYTYFDSMWEPIEKGLEMCGPGGGWSVIYNSDSGKIVDHIFGYSIEEVLERISKLPQAPESTESA